MNRSNSFVSSLKWWPLQGHTQHTTDNNNHIIHPNKISTFGSSVAIQKLRESKWFKCNEQKIFCAVVECGFIVEVRSYNEESSLHSQALAQDENEKPAISWFGIVLLKTTKDNKAKFETIEIFSVRIRENGTFKIIRMSLEEIWKHGYEIRINNFADKEKQPHKEKDIRNQVSFARKAGQSLWHNSKHFAYWCRYGSRQQDVRKRQMSECVKWGSVGMNAGMLLVMNKQKSYSMSK